MMKTFLLAALAATIATGPVMASAAEAAPAQQRRETVVVSERDNGRRTVTKRTVVREQYGRDYGQQRGLRANQYRNWRKGERFDRRYARNYRQIDYRQYRGLRAPPRGYRYYQSGNDAVLVAVASGVIAAVIAGAVR
ncbi:RcnB family protein [Sphingomonas longa]